jgi:peptidoglycan/LPS O-acetylase OafA/YrhL
MDGPGTYSQPPQAGGSKDESGTAAKDTISIGSGDRVSGADRMGMEVHLLMYQVWIGYYREHEKKSLSAGLWILLAVRIVLCMFPQNGWLENSSDMTWGIIRNIPFVLIGAIVCFLYYQKRNDDRIFRPVWLYILLSFLFYMPVAVGAGAVPMLGMLMLPKTVCYILLIAAFLRCVTEKSNVRYH